MDNISSLLFAGFAGFSLLLSLVSFIIAFTRYLFNSKALCAQVAKLAAAGDLERATKLCNAVPYNAIIVKLCVRSLKIAAQRAPSEELMPQIKQALSKERELIQRDTSHLQLLQAFSLLWLLGALYFALKLGEQRGPAGAVVIVGLLLWYAGARLEQETTLDERRWLPPLLRTISRLNK
jgi:hypothetical protein